MAQRMENAAHAQSAAAREHALAAEVYAQFVASGAGLRSPARVVEDGSPQTRRRRTAGAARDFDLFDTEHDVHMQQKREQRKQQEQSAYSRFRATDGPLLSDTILSSPGSDAHSP